MPNPGPGTTTGQSAVASDTAAFEQLAYFALRSEPTFDIICDVKTTAQTHNGSTVTFNIYADMAVQKTPLVEANDVSAVALSDSTVLVTLLEYGNAALTTAKLRGTSFLNVDADAANIIGYNMVNSIDEVIHDVMILGTNEDWAGDATSTATIDATDNLTADDVRKEVAYLRGQSATPFNGGVYVGFIHPDVSYDFRADQNVTDIIQYQIRQDGAAVRTGSIGTFAGVDFIETPRLVIQENAGSNNVDVYNTIVAGRQAMAKAYSRAPGFGPDPRVVFGPVTDHLRRFHPVGWYHLAGWSLFRDGTGTVASSLTKQQSSSSIGAN